MAEPRGGRGVGEGGTGVGGGGVGVGAATVGAAGAAVGRPSSARGAVGAGGGSGLAVGGADEPQAASMGSASPPARPLTKRRRDDLRASRGNLLGVTPV